MTLNSDGLDLMNDWSLGRTTAYGFELRGYDTSGNESDDYDWKLFDSANDGDVTSESYDGTTYSDCTGNCEPYLEITSEDDEAPQINSQYPPDNYNSPSLTPELLASGSDRMTGPMVGWITTSSRCTPRRGRRWRLQGM
jgi:hypothetical protein